MILAITYADKEYKKAEKLNMKSAKVFGADKTIAYTPQMISEEFKKENAIIWNQKKGGGLWIWKSYILKDALSHINYGDYVIYTDAGSTYINKITYLIGAMNKEHTDIMSFTLDRLEKYYSKRDAFVLMDCDEDKYTETPQRIGGYIILKKTQQSIQFIDELFCYMKDIRLLSEDDNVMGKPNYEGFIINRHDQTVLSLLSKKYNLPAFRDPSQYGIYNYFCSEEVKKRSQYPQIIDSHRNGKICTSWIYYRYVPKNVKIFIEKNIDRIKRRFLKQKQVKIQRK